MILLGISGKKQSGKDTIAKIIEELSSLPVYKYAFAGALKDEVAKACGVKKDFIEAHKAEFRTILQWWGCDFRRKFEHENYWTEKLFAELLSTPDNSVAIVTDVRFKNEADYLRDVGATLIRVERSGTLDTHQSEVDLDGYRFDYTIDNNDALPVLRYNVGQVMKQLKIKTK